MKTQLVPKSGNKKTGPIPVSYSERGTCPDACPYKGNGCYAEGWPLRLHWDNVPTAGADWSEFCGQVADLPEGQLWRHNGAGDLQGAEDQLDADSLRVLVNANQGKRGFTYTHKPVTAAGVRVMCDKQRREPTFADFELMRANRSAVVAANYGGFTVNVSCDSFEALDDLATPGLDGRRLALPAVVVIPMPAKGESSPKVMRTPAGIRVVACPAQYRETSCAECGLCQRADRDYAVSFVAHGNAKRKASNVVAANQLNRKAKTG